MKRINKAVVNPGAPADGNVFWVDTSNPDKPVLKIHDSNGWTAVGGEGGGSAEGAVSYNEQTLTDEQKMQARKNQGLYYSETVPEQTITWDGDTTGLDYFDWGGEI